MYILANKIVKRLSNYHNFPFVLFFIISTFLIIGFNNIAYPGFYYDEVLFANSLYGCKAPGVFTAIVFKLNDTCLPLLLMDYMGALKVFLLYPLKLFINFENVYSLIRGFGLFISSISIYLLYRLNKGLNLSLSINYFILLLFAFNMSFLFASKYDWGPITLAVLLKTFLVIATINLYTKLNLQNLIIYTVFLFLGIYNKLDFAFFGVPLTFFIVTSPKYFKLLKEYIYKYKYVVLTSLSFTIGSTAFAYFFYFSDLFKNEGFHSFTAAVKIVVIEEVLYGSAAYNLISNTDLSNKLLLTLPLMVLLIVPFLFLFKKNYYSQTESLIIKSFYLYLLILFLLKQSGASHHFISVFPLPFVVIGIFLNKYTKNLYARIFMLALLLLYLANSTTVYLKYQELIKSDRVSTSWSKGSENLSSYLQSNFPDKRILITDWGIANQQILLSQNNLQIEEIFRPIRKMDTEEGIMKIQNYDKENSVAVKSYNPTFKNVVDNFDYSYYSKKQIIEYDGVTIYEVYYND